MKSDKAATLTWILKYNRTPYPYSPQKAALKGMEPKQPGYFDGNYFKQLKWKDYQDWGSIDENFKPELIKAWHDDKRVEGIGCNAGFNGEFYFSMVDIDPKNFDSLEAMNQAIEGWENRNPGISLCPRVKTQSSGYRYFIGFESVPKNWGNTISFTFTQGGEKSLGELMVGSGGLGIILGKGLKGNYSWDRNACGDVPVFQSPESVGLFEIEKVQKINSIYDNKSISEEAREALNFIPVTQFDEDYQGWINLGMACQAAGLDFEDWDSWSQGSTKYSNSKDTFNHWKSFKEGGGITPGTLFKFAKDNGWNPPKRNFSYQKQLAQNSQSNVSGTAALKPETQSNVVPFQRQEPSKLPPIKEVLKALLEQNLSRADLDNELLELSAIYPRYSKNDIEKLYRKLSEEEEEKESQNDIKIELDELLKNKNQSLNLSEYLPDNLSKISEFASRLCLRPELGLSAFLTVCSSLLAVGSKIDLLMEYCQFDQKSLGMYTAICAEPSQKKSPLINKIALEPLLELQDEARKQYEQEMADYQTELADWTSDKNNPDPEPQKPIMRRFFISGGTQAGIRNVLNTHSKNGWGLLVLTDELAASYKNNSKTYNAGLLEDFLSFYDGYGKFEALNEGFKGDFSKCLVAMLGGIQPGVISNYMNGSDGNGHWSRVSVVNQPISPFIVPDKPMASLDIKPMLVDFYRKLSQLPQLHFTLDAKAKAGFITINNKCEQYRVTAKTQALASLWGKMPGKIGRFAALLHIIDQVWQYGTVQSLVVGKATLDRAVKLAKFYYRESYSLYAACTEDDLPSTLATIISIAAEHAKEHDGEPIAARNVVRHKDFRKKEFKDLKSADVVAMFTQLVEMGKGEFVGTGRNLRFSLSQLSQVVTTSCDKLKTIQDEDSSHLSQLSQEKNKNLETQPINMDDSTLLDEISKDGDLVVTIVTEPENDCVETISPCHNQWGQTVTIGTSNNETSDRSPEPQPEPIPPSEPEPLDINQFKEGDILFDNLGQPHKLIKPVRGMWQSHRNDVYISRNDIQQGKYHQATVEDITKLIERTIKGKNKAQAQWLCNVYGGDGDSLMAKAIDTNPEKLALIFDFDEW